MNLNKKNARIVGALFIIATVAGISSVAGTGDLNTPDYLVNVSANQNQIIIGALLVLIMGTAIAAIPIILFPILKNHNEALALGYVVFRVLEVVTLIGIAISFLLLLTLSQEYVQAGAPEASYHQTLGTLLLGAIDWINSITAIVFSLSALILNYIFYQSKLLPRWLSGWGLIGATFHLTGGLLGMFGFNQVDLLAAPIGLQEMVYALWLIVKGFYAPAIASGLVKQI